MIQRIQTVWLLLSVLIFGALFIFPQYEYFIPQNFGTAFKNYLGAKDYYPLLILAVLCVLFPMVAIFFFRDRKRQKGMVWLGILSALGFLGVLFMKIANLKNGTPPPTTDNYSIPGAILPILGIIFLVLAMRGINKDEKLVRSMDRLR